MRFSLAVAASSAGCFATSLHLFHVWQEGGQRQIVLVVCQVKSLCSAVNQTGVTWWGHFHFHSCFFFFFKSYCSWIFGADPHLFDASRCPDVIIFQHHHPAQVLSVHGDAAHQHRVLLHQSKAWGGLARTSYFSMPAASLWRCLEPRTTAGDPRGPGQAVQSRPFTKEEVPCWAPHHSGQGDSIWTCECWIKGTDVNQLLGTTLTPF